MSLVSVFEGPWAALPRVFTTAQEIYARHCRGEKVDIGTLEAAAGRPLSNQPQRMSVTPEGVAIVPIHGVLAKHASLVQQISGGTSTNAVLADFSQAVANPAVKAIVLDVDSPGGTVDGTMALADAVFAARGSKPIEAVIDGTCASAAYWIASAADKLFAATETTQIGSIGVIQTHVDQSAAESAAGLKVTEITSGKYKAAGTPHAPLDAASREYIQHNVDELHAIFAGAVQRNRKLTDSRLAAVADGRIHRAAGAAAAGLIDGMSSLNDRVAALGRAAKPLASVAAAARPILSVGDRQRAALKLQQQYAKAGLPVPSLHSALQSVGL